MPFSADAYVVTSESGATAVIDAWPPAPAPLPSMTGHIFFKDRWYGFDDAFYAAARMLELLLEHDEPPSKVFAELPYGLNTPELRVDMPEGAPEALMERLLAADVLKEGERTTIDGLRVDYPDGWGLVRASNTQPVLVLRAEGADPERRDAIERELRSLLVELGVESAGGSTRASRTSSSCSPNCAPKGWSIMRRTWCPTIPPRWRPSPRQLARPATRSLRAGRSTGSSSPAPPTGPKASTTDSWVRSSKRSPIWRCP